MEIMTNWEPESWSRMTKGGVHFLLSCRSVAPWGQRWSYVATARGSGRESPTGGTPSRIASVTTP